MYTYIYIYIYIYRERDQHVYIYIYMYVYIHICMYVWGHQTSPYECLTSHYTSHVVTQFLPPLRRPGY